MSIFTFLNEDIIKTTLLEDLHHGSDLTSQALIDASAHISVKLVAREDCILAGLQIIWMVFDAIDKELTVSVDAFKKDGDKASNGEVIAEIAGSAASILAGERTALNFVSHLSGIATETAKYVEKTSGTKARICATRKTLPGLRRLQKYAVEMGGGLSHRFGLDDAILIKDNHIAANGGDIVTTLKRAQDNSGHTTTVEIEVDTLDQLEKIIPLRPHIALLDNMDTKSLKKAVEMVNNNFKLEASGGVTLETVSDIAATGVDYISVGALTHSVKAIDFGLDS